MGVISRLRKEIGLYYDYHKMGVYKSQPENRIAIFDKYIAISGIPANIAYAISKKWAVTKIEWCDYNKLITYHTIKNVIDIKFILNDYKTLRLHFKPISIADMSNTGYSIPYLIYPIASSIRHEYNDKYILAIPYDTSRIFPGVENLIREMKHSRMLFDDSVKDKYPNIFHETKTESKSISENKSIDNSHMHLKNYQQLSEDIKELKSLISKSIKTNTEVSVKHDDSPKVDLRKHNRSNLCIPEIIGITRELLENHLFAESTIEDIIGELSVKLNDMGG